MELDGGVVVRPGPEVVSVMASLLHVMDATLCLEGQGTSTCLTARCLASTILLGITSDIINNQEKFEKGKKYVYKEMLVLMYILGSTYKIFFVIFFQKSLYSNK